MKHLVITVSVILFSATTFAGPVTITNTFSANTTAAASEVNQNFTDVEIAVDDNDSRITTNASGASNNAGNIIVNTTNITGNANALTVHGANAAAHHSKYTDANATAAMGAIGNANTLNHDRYIDAEAAAAMGAIDNANTLNHDRYTDAEAAAAMGPMGDTNTLNHDRYTNTEAVAAVGDRIRSSGGVAQRICAGSGINWIQYGTDSLYIDVDTSACGYSTTPTYFTSLSGASSHYHLIGVTNLYTETNTSFRVYVIHSTGSAITPTIATNYGWIIKWLAVGN